MGKCGKNGIMMTKELLIPSKEESRIIYGKISLPQDINIRNKPNRPDIPKPHVNSDNPEQKFRISPFTKIFEGGDGKIALFHSYLSKKMYGGDTLKKCLDDIKEGGRGDVEIEKKLVENEFIIPRSLSEQEFKQEFIKNFRNSIYNPIPNVTVMYFILTDTCNFACKYCFIEEGKGDFKGKPIYGNMNYETARAGVDFFINQIKSSGQKIIIFYGGEPLLNFEVMKKIVIYIREREKSGHFKGPVRIQIVTNGALITPDIANFFAEQKIAPGVSIDGPKEIHDKMRMFSSGRGSFDEAIRGYWLLKKAGVQPGISCTIGQHNVEVLDKIVEYFVKELGITGIGFNLPNLVKGQEDLMVPIEKVTESLIKAYAMCRKFGIREDRIWNRRVRPFVEEQFWVTDCAGCGNQIVVLPNGSVGPCHAFLGSAKYFKSSVFNEENIATNPVWIEWKSRAPIFMPQCLDCPAISICGGGCPYIAHETEGSIWKVDKRMCIFCNKVLEWLIGELHDKLYKR